MYNNGPRKGMMYGGGATPRKPMMYGGMTTKKKMNMGGLASQNRKKTTAQSAEMSPMGGMTEQKRFSMGMMYGGTANKKKMLYGGQAKLDMNKNNKIDKEDFKILKKKK
jgi:hypothetical protein